MYRLSYLVNNIKDNDIKPYVKDVTFMDYLNNIN